MPVIPVISKFVVQKGAEMYEFTIKISVPRVEILPFVARIVPPCTCKSELSPVSERVFALSVPLNEALLPVKSPVSVVEPVSVVAPVASKFLVLNPEVQI